MAQKIITTVLGLAIVGGLAWYVNKSYVQPTSDVVNVKVNSSKSASKSNASENLIYATFGSATEIISSNSTGKTKKLFTDADETVKVSSLSNLAVDINKVLATSTERANSQSDFSLIDLKTAKVSKLSNFSTTSPLVFSRDGKTFAYIVFSNVEENYGYNLYCQSISGDPVKIANAELEISQAAWSPDSKKISYVLVDGTKSELKIYDFSTRETKSLISLDGNVIDWVSWDQPNQILIAKRKVGNMKSGEIDEVDASSAKIKKMIEFSGGKAGFIHITSDGTKLAFIVAQYQDEVDPKTAGQIYVVDLATKKKTTLEKANQILGWER